VKRFKQLEMLKMLGLYLYTLIISHKFCKLLSILNKLTLQKDMQHFKSVIMDKKVKTQQQQNRKSNLKTLAGAGN